MNEKTKQSQEWRAEQRRLGFTPKLLWVSPLDWPAIQAFADKLKQRRKKQAKKG